MSDKYRKDLSIEILVGFFVFIILIALGVFTIVLSHKNFLQKTYPLSVCFDEIGGLRVGDHVFLRGMKVGVVKTTHLDKYHVNVCTDLDLPVQFRKGYKIEVVDSSMLGGKMMKIFEGPIGAPPIPKGEVIIGMLPVDILEELGSAVVDVKQLIKMIDSGEGTLGKLIKDDSLYNEMYGMMSNLKELSDELSQGKGTLGKLIQDDTIYNDLNEMVSNLKEISDKLFQGKGTIGKLLQDRTVYDDLQSTLANLDEVSERLVNGEGTLGKLLAKNDPVYHNLAASIANIRQITGKIEAGDGTIGRLVSDDQLYIEAQDLLKELRTAIHDMRETSPVTTFSTVLFGAF